MWRTFFHIKEGYLWNNLDKKVIIWHREAPLFLRVYINKKICYLGIIGNVQAL